MLTPHLLQSICKNDNFQDKALLSDVVSMFHEKPEATEFLYLYGIYGELVDDMVDEECTPAMVQQADELVQKIGNCAYWQRNQSCLWVVRWLVHNQYFDTTKWEKDEEEWKRRDAKAMSHCGYLMLFAVILIEFGVEKLNEISLRFRTHAHLRHVNDPI